MSCNSSLSECTATCPNQAGLDKQYSVLLWYLMQMNHVPHGALAILRTCQGHQHYTNTERYIKIKESKKVAKKFNKLSYIVL